MFSMSFSAIAAENTATIENIFVDTTVPNTPTLGGISENWVNEDVVVTVSNISDPVENGVSSGVEKIEYSVGGTTGEDTSGANFTMTVSTEGESTVTAKAIDKVGNESEQASGVVKLDKTAPTITIEGVVEAETYHTAVAPIFDATDGLSGINGSPTATLAKDGDTAEAYTSGTSISDPGLYTLSVTAKDNADNTTIETASFILGTVTMEGVDINAVAKSPTSIEINWSAIDNAIGYKVYEGETELANIAAISYTHEGLDINTHHTYKVVPYNALGDGTVSNTVTVYTFSNAPANLVVTNKTSTTLAVAWEGNNNPTGTEYSASIDGVTWTDFVADKLTHEFTGLSVGNSYTISIKARNGDGLETDSISITDSTNTAPTLTINTPESGSAYSEVAGHNTITVTGTVADADNDDITVTANLKNTSGTVVATKTTTLEKCGVAKEFTLEFTVTSGIPEGKYSIDVTVSDGK